MIDKERALAHLSRAQGLLAHHKFAFGQKDTKSLVHAHVPKSSSTSDQKFGMWNTPPGVYYEYEDDEDDTMRKSVVNELMRGPVSSLAPMEPDGCNDRYFDAQSEGICYSYAALGLIVKALMLDQDLRARHPLIDSLYNRMQRGERLLVADLTDTKCRKGFDSAVWKVYDEVLQRLGRHDADHTDAASLARGGNAGPLLAALLLTSRYTVKMFHRNRFINMATSRHYELNVYQDDIVTGDWVERIQKESDGDVYIIADSPRHLTGYGRLENFKYGGMYVNLLSTDLERFRKQNLIHRVIGGFFTFYRQEHNGGEKDRVHDIMFMICKGKLLVCNSHENVTTADYFGNFRNNCEGLERPAYMSNVSGWTHYGVQYVIQPFMHEAMHPASVGPYKYEDMRKMIYFELEKPWDYPGYDIQEGTKVRYRGNCAYVVSKESAKVRILTDSGVVTTTESELSYVPYEERIFGNTPSGE